MELLFVFVLLEYCFSAALIRLSKEEIGGRVTWLFCELGEKVIGGVGVGVGETKDWWKWAKGIVGLLEILLLEMLTEFVEIELELFTLGLTIGSAVASGFNLWSLLLFVVGKVVAIANIVHTATCT